jgi:hypothetical protein
VKPAESVKIERCAQCGAEVADGRQTCWLCGAAQQPVGEAAISPAAQRQAVRSFGLDSMFLVTALVAVCLGVFVQAPGLGIGLAILSAPALVRTTGIRTRRKSRGQPMSVGEKIVAFAGSLAVVTTIAVASLGTFVAICFPMGAAAFDANAQILFGLAWVFGILGGLVVGFFLIRRLWRRKE